MIARSISARFAAIYFTAFAFAVVVLGVVVLLATRATLREQFESRIRAESAALVEEYRSEGLHDVLEAVRERDRAPGALAYGLIEPDGAPIAGGLARLDAPDGWSIQTVAAGGATESAQVWGVRLPDDYRLLVGDDRRHIAALDGLVLRGFALTLLGVIVIGGFAGHVLSRDIRRRLSAITDVAESVSGGDLKRRVLLARPTDELDDLALTLNRMLDRIAALMESVRQVSSDVAHDLRTPLTRLRQRVEALKTARPAARDAAVDAALADLDGILETFAALLRIAQIEAGARRAGFRAVDLAEIGRLVVDSFAPSAEDSGRTLLFEGHGPAMIEGDAELLTQMLVNLVENGLRHTPPGVTVRVRVETQPPALTVADNGPGAPAAEHGRLFDRFYRLEQSRRSPGDGLGLSLVAAVAKLHDTTVNLADAGPGLAARIAFRPLA